MNLGLGWGLLKTELSGEQTTGAYINAPLHQFFKFFSKGAIPQKSYFDHTGIPPTALQ
jgi:hypothetical protein